MKSDGSVYTSCSLFLSLLLLYYSYSITSSQLNQSPEAVNERKRLEGVDMEKLGSEERTDECVWVTRSCRSLRRCGLHYLLEGTPEGI